MKVLFLTNVPSPYRVEFFNQLSEYCDLTVLYQKNRSSERNEKWIGRAKSTYKSVFLQGVSTGVDQALSFEVIKYLKKGQYDRIFICGIASPTEMLALTWCKIMRIPYYFESDGGIHKSGKGIKEFVKRFNLSGAVGYLSTGKMHDEYYLAYGVSQNKLLHYPFSSITEADILKKPLRKAEKEEIRRKHGYKASMLAITVGQFIPRKGFDLLIKAWARMDKNFLLLIVGGKAPEEYTNLVNKNQLSNIQFVPFMSKQELSEYYKMADLFVFPTREDIWGLVVNEAMAYGLPMVASDRSGAAIEMVEPDINGYIFAHENIRDLEDKLLHFFSLSEAKQEEMAIKSIEKAGQYIIEKMVKRHSNI